MSEENLTTNNVDDEVLETDDDDDDVLETDDEVLETDDDEVLETDDDELLDFDVDDIADVNNTSDNVNNNITDDEDNDFLDFDVDDIGTTEFDDLIDFEIDDIDIDMPSGDATTQEELIKDSLAFMQWSTNSLYTKWMSVVGTSVPTTEYTKFSRKSKTSVLYLETKEQCKQNPKRNSCMGFIHTLAETKLRAMQSAIAQINTGKPETIAEVKFYFNLLQCKTFEDALKIPCGDINLKRRLHTELRLMRDIWEFHEDEKVPTLASKSITEYRDGLTEYQAILAELLSGTESILDKCTLPTSIKFQKGVCTLGCTCGNTVNTTSLVTFNLINISSNELSSSRLKDLISNCNDAGIRRWLLELQNAENVFSNPSNTEMLADLEASRVNGDGMFTVFNNYITSAHSSCGYNPNVICECGKHIILPPKLLRYLVAWHISHGEDIYRSATDNETPPGFIVYRDQVLLECLEAFQRGMYTAGEANIQKSIKEFGETVDTEALKRNSMNRLQYEAGPVIEIDNDKIITSRSVREAFDRIRARESRHNLNLSNYQEATENRNSGNKNISDYKSNLPINYWRSYNTSSEDKMLSALIYSVESMHLPFEVGPKYVLSELFRQPAMQPARKAIIAQAMYTSILYNYEVYCKYVETTGDTSQRVYSAEASKGNWRIAEENVYGIAAIIGNSLARYQECYPIFDEDMLKQFEDPAIVNKQLITEMINVLTLKHENHYVRLRFPRNLTLPKIIKTSNIDTEFIQYITDELPWRTWYKLSLIHLIQEHNPVMVESFAKESTKSLRASRGAKKLEDIVLKAAETGNLQAGEIFWKKIPLIIRGNSDIVLNKNLQEVAILTTSMPLPMTTEMLALLLQSDSTEHSKSLVENYIKTSLMGDILELHDTESLGFDVATLDSDSVWEDAIEWLLTYTPESYNEALPKYIREMKSEVA